jgi:hypothetical protein
VKELYKTDPIFWKQLVPFVLFYFRGEAHVQSRPWQAATLESALRDKSLLSLELFRRGNDNTPVCLFKVELGPFLVIQTDRTIHILWTAGSVLLIRPRLFDHKG